MKIVILAAGKGSRLGDIASPKPLTKLSNGETILGRQVKLFLERFPESKIQIIVGYKKEEIIEQFSFCEFTENPDFGSENTAKSLLRAVKKIDDDLLFINGDVVFHPHVLNEIALPGLSKMLVNSEKKMGSEEIKYKLSPEGNIMEVSKSLENAEGEALGLNFILKKDIPLFLEGLEKCNMNDYFEKGIEFAIRNGLKIAPCKTSVELCKEIDFPDDLTAVNRLLGAWSGRVGENAAEGA